MWDCDHDTPHACDRGNYGKRNSGSPHCIGRWSAMAWSVSKHPLLSSAVPSSLIAHQDHCDQSSATKISSHSPCTIQSSRHSRRILLLNMDPSFLFLIYRSICVCKMEVTSTTPKAGLGVLPVLLF